MIQINNEIEKHKIFINDNDNKHLSVEQAEQYKLLKYRFLKFD